jgi:tyrosine-protein kinase Etk/Wzc
VTNVNTPYLLGSSVPSAPQPAVSQYQSEDDAFVLKDLVSLIVDQIWWVLGIAAAIILIATTYAMLATPTYVADAMLQVEAPNSNTMGVTQQNQAPAMAITQAPTDAEIQLLKSRAVLAPVVDQFKLAVSVAPHVLPVIGSLAHRFATPGQPSRPWLGMKSYGWGGEVLSIATIEVPSALEGTKLTLRALGDDRYELLDKDGRLLLQGTAGANEQAGGVSLRVDQLAARAGTEFDVVRYNQLNAIESLALSLQVAEQGKQTGVVEVSLEGRDPQRVTDITNAVVASYITQHIAHRQEEASKMLSFLQGELPRFRGELEKAEQALSDYRAHAGTLTPTAESQTYLQGGMDYERQIAALNLQRTQLLQRFTPEHPQIRALDQQMAQLNTERARFESRFLSLPGSEREAVSLERNAKVAEEIYVALLNKTQELSVNRAGTVGNVHVVDEAMRPTSPVAPKRGLIIGAATLFGLIIGVLVVFVRRNFFTGVEDPEFVERNMHLPVFGSISYSAEQGRLDESLKQGKLPPKPVVPGASPSRAVQIPAARQSLQAKKPVLAKSNPHDMTIEGLRSFRTALQFGMIDAPNKIVALTGPAPSIGKTFLSANLGVLLAETGKRVLIVDADLRRGRLAQYFGRTNEGGLTELLSGQISVSQAVTETGVNGLYLLPAGAFPPNPSELLMSNAMRQLFDDLDKQFDMVIVDTPPVLAVTDASIVANMAGTTVLVMRSGAHTEGEIAETLKKLHRAGARIMGGVFNAVPLRSLRSTRHGGYEYAYQYRYETEMK